MASAAKIAMNDKKKALVAKYAVKRAELKAIIKNPSTDRASREQAMAKLSKLPRNSSATRVRNRCALTGRPRAYYRKFGLSRIAVRDLGLAGEIPGLTKSSW